MRVLGLDYGSKRIGVAVSDELGITARGIATIIRKDRKHDMDAIGEFIDKYCVEKIIVGYPIRLDGTEGIQCMKVKRFVSFLESNLSLPIISWDETLTTKTAEDILIQANMHRAKRKKVIDKLAASLILQDYLDRHGLEATP